MKKLDIVQKAFPYSIRMTVHPKQAAQLALHTTNPSNQLLPYNGVPVISRKSLEKGNSLFDSCRIKRFCDVLNYNKVYAVYTNKKNPYYYEVE